MMEWGQGKVKDGLRKTAVFFSQKPLVELALGAYSEVNGKAPPTRWLVGHRQ
jgi:hypothetical protein